jgi:hypothetical protein
VPDKNTEKADPLEKAAKATSDKRQANKEWARKAQGKNAGDTLPDPLPEESEE